MWNFYCKWMIFLTVVCQHSLQRSVIDLCGRTHTIVQTLRRVFFVLRVGNIGHIRRLHT